MSESAGPGEHDTECLHFASGKCAEEPEGIEVPVGHPEDSFPPSFQAGHKSHTSFYYKVRTNG